MTIDRDTKGNQAPDTGVLESNEHEVRLSKVTKLQEENINPWPAFKHNSVISIHEALTNFTHEPNPEQNIGKTIELAGRLMSRRDHGKTFFCNLQDRSDKIQLYIKKDVLENLENTKDHDSFEDFKKYIDTGDIVWVKGQLFTTKTGETTLKVTNLELLSKCLHPLPEKFHGLTDIEQRYRQRYLDLMSNPESREKFKKRSLIVQAIRNFLHSKDFLEVETPMLHPIPGGAAARPFVTHHNAYNMDLYLRIAPELYLKRLVVGGFDRVFEINRNFRNEGVSTRHNPEFTMLEFYMAYGDYRDGMKLTEELLQDAVLKNFDSLELPFQEHTINFSAPFKRLTVEESLCEIGGLTKDQISEKNIDALLKTHGIELHTNAGHGVKLFALFEACVEAKIIQPTFIIGYPIEVSPLAKRDENNPNVAARFELFMCGMEFANGFSELNDPFDQAERFKSQVSARESGDAEAHHYDADYIKALEYGLPPAVGVGIGIDRLVMLLTNTSAIKDVILFPTLKISHATGQEHNTKTPASKLSIDPVIMQKYPGVRLGVVIAYDTKNSSEENPEITSMLRAQEEQLKTLFKTEAPAHHAHIKIWRDAYKKFGSDPEKYLSSIENLSTRILAGNKTRHISTLVDLYNFVSLKYLLPAGAEDIDHLDGDVSLTIANENEVPVIAFGEKEAKKPDVGEVIYKDLGGTLCRRWNWRGTERSKLTAKTKNAFFVLEALPPVTDKQLEQAVQELAQLVAKYCGGTIVTMITSDKNSSAQLARVK